MEKILTVSIAAYNVEAYIRQTLDSLMDESIIDALEIFVVDDGGKDGTLEIVQEYANRHPKSVFPVHKENGGYGSTVNYSIEHAHGKYFKLLDGDDWFHTGHLKELIMQLSDAESDVVITPYYKCVDGGDTKEKNNIRTCRKNKDIKIADIPVGIVGLFGMWSITYKTEVLRRSGMQLPLHCLYTDQIYSTIPFAYAESIRFIDCAVYCYRIGRDGQSVSKESRIAHMNDNMLTCEILLSFYEKQKADNNPNIQYIKYRVAGYVRNVLKTYMLRPVSREVLDDVKAYDQTIKETYADIYEMLKKVNIMRKFTPYIYIVRLCRYGKIALLLGKILFPDGIKNWA